MKLPVLLALLSCVGLLAPPSARAGDSAAIPVSAFATGVGHRTPDGAHPAVALLEVPADRIFILTDVVISAGAAEVGSLQIGDGNAVRLVVSASTSVTIGGNPVSITGGTHHSYAAGVPFDAGQTVFASFPTGSQGVDVTIMGRLVRAPRSSPRAIRLEGASRAAGAPDADDGAAPAARSDHSAGSRGGGDRSTRGPDAP